MRKYEFPATRKDIEHCCDVAVLHEWEERFITVLTQMDSDFGGIENVPEKMKLFAHANQCNLQQIKYRIHRLNSPVTSAGALKCFHDVVKELLPNEYEHLTEEARIRLGRAGTPWEELIRHKKQNF